MHYFHLNEVYQRTKFIEESRKNESKISVKKPYLIGPGARAVTEATVSEGYMYFAQDVTLFAHDVTYFQQHVTLEQNFVDPTQIEI